MLTTLLLVALGIYQPAPKAKGSDDGQDAQHPVNVTVQLPQPSADEKQKDNDRRDAEAEVQRRMAVANERMVYTSWGQLIATILVFLVALWALRATIDSAKAAQQSANAAVMAVAADQRAWVGFEIELATLCISTLCTRNLQRRAGTSSFAMC